MDFLKLVRLQWDRAAAVAALVLGALALLVGYLGISGTGFAAEQLPYIVSGGITGLFCLGIAATLYLSADIRDEWRKLDDIDRRLEAIETAALAQAPARDEPKTNGIHPVKRARAGAAGSAS
jgi:hypothetical protein